jgi:hypothetical protein
MFPYLFVPYSKTQDLELHLELVERRAEENKETLAHMLRLALALMASAMGDHHKRRPTSPTAVAAVVATAAAQAAGKAAAAAEELQGPA